MNNKSLTYGFHITDLLTYRLYIIRLLVYGLYIIGLRICNLYIKKGKKKNWAASQLCTYHHHQLEYISNPDKAEYASPVGLHDPRLFK